MTPQRVAVICEGPTDTAAAVELGYYAIGRPSCRSGVAEINHLVRRLGVHRAIIVSDNDRPDKMGHVAGLSGAEALQQQLLIPSCIVMLPLKDMREFKVQGGNRDTLEALVRTCIWSKK